MDYVNRILNDLFRLAPYAVFFVSLAVITKKSNLISSVREGSRDLRITIGFYLIDVLFVAPLAAILSKIAVIVLGSNSATASLWQNVSPWLILPIALLVGDYVGYWRHRISHSPPLWPIHVAHHSDRSLNWFSLIRTHPLERFYTAFVDSAFLALLGLPLWAIAANNFVRSSWGFFIHANLPWTLGGVGKVLISPMTHRLHHVRTPAQAGSNFATLFTFWDRLHGTFAEPRNDSLLPTGVEGHHLGFTAEMIYPLIAIASSMKSHFAGIRSLRADSMPEGDIHPLGEDQVR